MSDKIVKYIRNIMVVCVLIILTILAGCNIKIFLQSAKQVVGATDLTQNTINFSEIENLFRESSYLKNEMVDVYGLYKKAIGNNIIGNFEYVIDKEGVIHRINMYEPYDVEGFIREMGELQELSKQNEIPLIYLQAPNKEIHNEDDQVEAFNIDDETMDELVKAMAVKQIPVLDIREKLESENPSFDLSDTFLHTDLHMSTDAEIFMADQLAIYLEEMFDVKIDNEKYMQDLSNYRKESYPFLGNYGRTNGGKYVGLDTFDMYFPNFETSYSYVNPQNPETNKTGQFQEVLMNGYTESENIDEYTYFVTNYMQFTQPYYTVINHNQPEGLKLLVVTDSLGYRTLSYLSLGVNQVTIVDPRFFGGYDYITKAMEEHDFDVVIVFQGTFLIGNEFIY